MKFHNNCSEIIGADSRRALLVGEEGVERVREYLLALGRARLEFVKNTAYGAVRRLALSREAVKELDGMRDVVMICVVADKTAEYAVSSARIGLIEQGLGGLGVELREIDEDTGSKLAARLGGETIAVGADHARRIECEPIKF